eukprot:5366189-Amphidinium_carterae.1
MYLDSSCSSLGLVQGLEEPCCLFLERLQTLAGRIVSPFGYFAESAQSSWLTIQLRRRSVSDDAPCCTISARHSREPEVFP